ncbi:uncharacterized protein LOC122850927 [Aphidius gifuensis]|uniref:uncharacterized protein LOC122850927 n=1 Tax=Aphidius gifuensis TaxID=684658 RepID=UPI001CDCCEDA|nr:uncharacterized protein LOC122850927 [Aphidius gifuensis]
MEEILNIQKPIIFDESVAHYELHTHLPYGASKFNNSDEIRIGVQHQDLCLLPSKSSLHITGKFTKSNGTAVAATTSLVKMSIAHMFEEIRYEINGIEVDRSKNVGLTTLIKGYVSFNPNQKAFLENTGWINDEKIFDNEGNFNISIPLSILLGFAEDYRKIIINAKHELIIVRSNTDTNAYKQTTVADAAAAAAENVKISLEKIEWIVPYIRVSDKQKIQLLNFIAKDPSIAMSFRTWELYDYPLLPATTKHIWSVKTSTQLEKPRYVIVGFQTARKNVANKDASLFDHCKMRDIKLFLNSQSYPYGNLNINITQNQYALLYDMFAQFQVSYYGKESEPLLTKKEYIDQAPLIVIDCSKQNKFLKSEPVDIRLEFESFEQFPAETSAYCLILHDRIVEYNPISGSVRELV